MIYIVVIIILLILLIAQKRACECKYIAVPIPKHLYNYNKEGLMTKMPTYLKTPIAP